jgi:hypothetical protein
VLVPGPAVEAGVEAAGLFDEPGGEEFAPMLPNKLPEAVGCEEDGAAVVAAAGVSALL